MRACVSRTRTRFAKRVVRRCAHTELTGAETQSGDIHHQMLQQVRIFATLTYRKKALFLPYKNVIYHFVTNGDTSSVKKYVEKFKTLNLDSVDVNFYFDLVGKCKAKVIEDIVREERKSGGKSSVVPTISLVTDFAKGLIGKVSSEKDLEFRVYHSLFSTLFASKQIDEAYKILLDMVERRMFPIAGGVFMNLTKHFFEHNDLEKGIHVVRLLLQNFDLVQQDCAGIVKLAVEELTKSGQHDLVKELVEEYEKKFGKIQLSGSSGKKKEKFDLKKFSWKRILIFSGRFSESTR